MIRSERSLLRWWDLRGVMLLLAGLGLAACPNGWAAPPTLLSVTPANGATGAGATTPLVFTFDQVMDKTVPYFPTSPGVPLVGNFEFLPASFALQVSGTWSADGRSLTVRPNLTLPLNQTFQWKLNPAGTVFPYKNLAGEVLQTVSGSYSTGVAAPNPVLSTVSPASGVTNVPVGTTVVFTFNEPMKTNTAIAGAPPSVPGAISWTGTEVNAAKVRYSWSSDSRSLSCIYEGGFPAATTVSWMLNPGTAPVKLEGVSGRAVAVGAYSGTFTTSGSAAGCDPDGIPETWGQYSVFKASNHEQVGAAAPTPAVEDPPVSFSAVVFSPFLGPFVTSASLTKPDATASNLTVIGGTGQWIVAPASEAVLNQSFPAGAYTLRFTQVGQPERTVSLTLPGNPPPVPRIANLVAAQSINAGAAFTLQWDAFAGASDTDMISLSIGDGQGNVLFEAPNACVPRPLDARATSIVIPAGTLLGDTTYSATLSFGRISHRDTNSLPQMAGYAGFLRNTRFEIRTAGSSPSVAATARDARLLPSGQAQFDVSGSAGRTYGVQRTSSLTSPAWGGVGTVTLDAGGNGTFTDPQTPAALPAFYRVVSQ